MPSTVWRQGYIRRRVPAPCASIIKQTIGKVALAKSMFRPTHFAVGLVLEKAFSGHGASTVLPRDMGVFHLEDHHIA